MNESNSDSVGRCETMQAGNACILNVSPVVCADVGKQFVAVVRKGKRVAGVYMRSGFYYARFKDPVSAKWVWRKAPEQSVDGALRIVREAKAAGGSMRAERFRAALDGAKARRSCCSMQQLMDGYSKVAGERCQLLEEPRARTIYDRLCAVRRVLRASGRNPEEMGADELPAVVKAWALKRIDGGTGLASVFSEVNQVKALFSGWAIQGYAEQGLSLPDGLMKSWPRISHPASRYKLPPLELRQRTIAAGNAEIVKRSRIGAVFALAFYGGMAVVDIALAEWGWVRGGKMVYERHKTGSRAEPPLPPEIVEALASWPGRGGRDTIIEGKSLKVRMSWINRHFSGWMRELGWDPVVYQKAAHELRKLAGSYWLTECGLSWAAKWLGDTEATAAKFYCDLLPEESPTPRNMFSGSGGAAAE